MEPPKMSVWNLVLRFALELAALTGFCYSSFELASGNMRWILAIGLPVVAAITWGTFNVLNDPSRSGKAPVVVSGLIRLSIEILILFGAVVMLAFAEKPNLAMILGALVVFHYIASWSRVNWLIRQ
jgi:drug/metabolite transporter (DMT)-like permease